MAEKWTMHGKVTCDLCLEEQGIPAGTAPDEDRAKPHLPGWTRIAGQGGWPPAGRILDLCKLCGAVPLARVLDVCERGADAELREELRRARRGGDWDNVRTLAPALRGGPREEADKILVSRRLWEWAEKADPAELMAAVPLHQTDRLRSVEAWGELVGRLVRAVNKNKVPPVTAEWLVEAAEGTPLEESLMVKRTLRGLKRDYMQAGPQR
jgi:hypothetical protein